MDAGRLGEALRTAEQLLEQAANDTDRLLAHRLVGACRAHLGLWREARHHCEAAVALYDQSAHVELRHQYAQDQLVSALGYLAWTQLALGFPDLAQRSMERAIAHARSLDHPHSLAFALNVATDLLLLLQSGSGLRVLGGELAHLGKARGFGFHTSGGIVALGCADALEGRHADAIARLQQGLEGYMAANAGYQVPFVLGELARACAGSGRLAEAEVHVREALAASERTGERSSRAGTAAHRGRHPARLRSGDRPRGAVLPGSAGDCEAAGRCLVAAARRCLPRPSVVQWRRPPASCRPPLPRLCLVHL